MNELNLPAKGNNWRYLIVNVNGLRSKATLLETVVDYTKPDVIIGCESKITSKVGNAEVFPPGYQKDVFRKDRTDHGGGVFLAFRDGFVVSQVENSETNCDSVWAEVSVPKQSPLFICSFYRPPGSGAEPLQELSRAINGISPKGDKHIVVAGDINCGFIDWHTTSVEPNARETDAHNTLLDLLNEHSLTNTQHSFTRENKNLDLHLTSLPSLVKSQSVIPGISDHDITVIDSEIRPKFNPPTPRKIYSYNRASWDKIKEETVKFKDAYLTSSGSRSVNDNWEALKKHLHLMLEKHIPSKNKSTRYNLPWLTTPLRRLIRRKHRLYNKARKSKKPDDWTAYKKLKKDLHRSIKKAHAEFVDKTLTEALNEGNSKPFWNYIKSKRKDSGGVAPLKHKGVLHSSSAEKAQILNTQFSSVFTHDKMDDIPVIHGPTFPNIDPIIISEAGVQKLLSKLAPTKASGPDCIPNHLLRELSNEVAPILAHLFTQSLATGQHPDDWKDANISPIYKKDDKHTASNYRPVSLTCVCSKLLEHIVVSHLMAHIDKHNILTDLQHGFRKHRSCVTQLLLTVSDLTKYFDFGYQTDICILDFSKAFDVVSHRKLLAKLDHYGIRNDLAKWIKGFLVGRKQRVVVEGVSSNPEPVLSGVPQGTCLGPILFLCYINDITHNIKSHVRLFADDALLYRPIHSPDDHQTMQLDLLTLEKWAHDWDMKFNPSKCYIMSMKRTGDKSIHFYTLCSQVLKTVATNPYLGILFSEDMSFTTHIRNICTKSSRTLGFLSRNLKNCPNKLREIAYISMCRSTLEYASTIWDPYLIKDQQLIERIQRKAARFVSKDYRQKSSVTVMMRNMKWEPMDERRKKSRLILLYQIMNDMVAIPSDIEYLVPGRRGRFKHLTHKRVQYKNSFFPQTIRDWNLLSVELKESQSLEKFKSRLPTRPY